MELHPEAVHVFHYSQESISPILITAYRIVLLLPHLCASSMSFRSIQQHESQKIKATNRASRLVA